MILPLQRSSWIQPHKQFICPAGPGLKLGKIKGFRV
jgi:hypothetical protein